MSAASFFPESFVSEVASLGLPAQTVLYALPDAAAYAPYATALTGVATLNPALEFNGFSDVAKCLGQNEKYARLEAGMLARACAAIAGKPVYARYLAGVERDIHDRTGDFQALSALVSAAMAAGAGGGIASALQSLSGRWLEGLPRSTFEEMVRTSAHRTGDALAPSVAAQGGRVIAAASADEVYEDPARLLAGIRKLADRLIAMSKAKKIPREKLSDAASGHRELFDLISALNQQLGGPSALRAVVELMGILYKVNDAWDNIINDSSPVGIGIRARLTPDCKIGDLQTILDRRKGIFTLMHGVIDSHIDRFHTARPETAGYLYIVRFVCMPIEMLPETDGLFQERSLAEAASDLNSGLDFVEEVAGHENSANLRVALAKRMVELIEKVKRLGQGGIFLTANLVLTQLLESLQAAALAGHLSAGAVFAIQLLCRQKEILSLPPHERPDGAGDDASLSAKRHSFPSRSPPSGANATALIASVRGAIFGAPNRAAGGVSLEWPGETADPSPYAAFVDVALQRFWTYHNDALSGNFRAFTEGPDHSRRDHAMMRIRERAWEIYNESIKTVRERFGDTKVLDMRLKLCRQAADRNETVVLPGQLMELARAISGRDPNLAKWLFIWAGFIANGTGSHGNFFDELSRKRLLGFARASLFTIGAWGEAVSLFNNPDDKAQCLADIGRICEMAVTDEGKGEGSSERCIPHRSYSYAANQPWARRILLAVQGFVAESIKEIGGKSRHAFRGSVVRFSDVLVMVGQYLHATENAAASEAKPIHGSRAALTAGGQKKDEKT